MIARVRIAPMKQWCAPARAGFARYGDDLPAPVGELVGIETTSMRVLTDPRLCGGRAWEVRELPGNIVIANAIDGEEVEHPLICEHLVELD